MSVWVIPACDIKSVNNYTKTLTSPISPKRLAKANKYHRLPEGQLFAWGFPDNNTNREKIKNMEAGDICFFYILQKDIKQYWLAARVFKVFLVPSEAKFISKAFWDDDCFLPYLLDKPISISVSPETFGKSLNPEDSYMTNPARGAMRLSDEQRAHPAITEYSTFDAWALDLISNNVTKSNSSNEIIEYFTKPIPGSQDERIAVVNSSLFQPKGKVKNPVFSGSIISFKRSKQSKRIGDLGEKIIYKYLTKILPEHDRLSLVWVANSSKKPGWDIEYRDSSNNLIAIEVKTTTAAKFESIEITANELEAAMNLMICMLMIVLTIP